MTSAGRTAGRIARAALLAAALAPAAAHGQGLTIEEAIRAAWSRNPALRASAAQVEATRAEAAQARAGHLPTLSLTARGVRTQEPMMVFGTKLDQGRITLQDFDPARLNDPDAIGGIGGGVTVSVPLYAGGRITAGTRATTALADAESASDRRRRQVIAVSVVESYFGAQVAEEGVRHADDLLAQATETERFVRERTQQGLALEADLARSAAFRAQAQAERATALQRLASARSALALLIGEEAVGAELATPVAALQAGAALAPEELPPDTRPDLVAARRRREAADAGVSAARGALLPALFAQASAETMRTPDLEDGTAWTTLALVARWDLSLADRRALSAASARARAAEEALSWRRREAEREVGEARRAAQTADARVASATDAVTASEHARDLRAARHRQGLLPLTDVLDAETALAGARALLLASLLEARVARAQLALALDQPIEGLNP